MDRERIVAYLNKRNPRHITEQDINFLRQYIYYRKEVTPPNADKLYSVINKDVSWAAENISRAVNWCIKHFQIVELLDSRNNRVKFY